jgi:hypothetical protein
MNKKITFTGIILALILLTMNSAFAGVSSPGADFTIADTAPATSPSGNPGDTVTMTFNLSTTAVTKTIGLTSSVLSRTGGTETISAPTILTQTVTSANALTPSFNIVLPATMVGTYTGTITGTESGSSPANVATLAYTVTVLGQDKLDVKTYDNATALEIIGEEGQTGLTGTFNIENTGSNPLQSLTFDTAALDLSDSDNDAITLSFSDPGTMNPGETKTVTITASFGNNIDLDTYGGTMTVKTGSTSLDTFKLDLKVHPEICEDGIVSDGDPSSRTNADLDLDIKEPDNGDDFKPGDDINIDVKVDNDGDDDLDVVVEAILYNLDEDEEVATAESSTEEIKDGDDESFEFELEVPRDSSLDEDDRYVMFIKAFEDGDEDLNCNFDSVDMDFKREKDDIVVKDVEVVPNSVRPGQNFEVIVDMENEGTKDQKDVYVKVLNSELGFNVKSNEFDLDKAGDSDDDITRRFTLSIPEDAEERDYTIEVSVFDDNDDVYDNGQEFVTVTVKGESTETKTTTKSGNQVDLNVVSQTSEIDASKERVNLHLLFTNNEDEDLTATVDISTIGDWADPISSQTVSLHPGENNLYFTLKLKDVEEGTYSASVTVRPTGGSDFNAKTFSLNFNVKGKSGLSGITGAFTGGGTSSTVFWIIGDVLLIIVALFFIKAIFFGKK